MPSTLPRPAPALTALALAGALLLATGADAQERTLSSALSRVPGIRGLVVDRETGEPIGDAAVTVELLGPGVDHEGTLTVLTNPDGRFVLADMPSGHFGLRVQRLGYRTVRDSVTHERELGLRVSVEMAQEALELEPLMVITRARSRALQANGFYDRRRRGLGHHITRDEAALANAFRVSDAFRGMAGVRVSSDARMGQRGIIRLRAGCMADVYLDGTRTVTPFPVDDLLAPQDIEAVEIYRASEVPPQYGFNNCGVVLIWTHVPEQPSGQSWSWTKFFIGAAFFGLTWLLK